MPAIGHTRDKRRALVADAHATISGRHRIARINHSSRFEGGTPRPWRPAEATLATTIASDGEPGTAQSAVVVVQLLFGRRSVGVARPEDSGPAAWTSAGRVRGRNVTHRAVQSEYR